MERVAIDITGLFPETDGGKKYIHNKIPPYMDLASDSEGMT